MDGMDGMDAMDIMDWMDGVDFWNCGLFCHDLMVG
jgi:hypothetical protein